MQPGTSGEYAEKPVLVCSMRTASPYDLERLGIRCRLVTPNKHTQDRLEHSIQFLTYILGKKPQHEVAVLLQQLVLPSVATIRDGTGQVLSTIQFDGYSRVSS